MTVSLSTVEFIISNGLAAISDKYKIKIRRHKDYPSLVMFKYDQLESPMGERIVQECRGLILDESNNWSIVSFPFKKFFNHGEGHAASIDWNAASVYEKLDGSLTVLYTHDSKWNVSTSGTPDASGQLGFESKTFHDLFWETWIGLGYQLPTDTKFCFMFELMTPENIILVRHKKSRIVLHGVRDLTTLKELSPEPFAQKYGWECVQKYPLGTLNDILKSVAAINPMENEGYVVVDADFNRIKVKSPQYVALSHIKEGMSQRRLIEIIQSNEGDEFLNYFPEFKSAYFNIKTKYDSLRSEAEIFYETIKGIEVQKDFALCAVKKPYSGILFSVRGGKITSVSEGFSLMSPQNVETILGL